MAISSYKTFLMYKKDSTYTKLIDIKNYPDLGGSPETLDTTTLTDKMRTHIPGIQDTSSMEFDCNYTKTDFETLDALASDGNELDLAVWFGGTESQGKVSPSGSEGKFEFKGYITVYVSGGGVNEVVGMKVVVTPSTVIKPAQA